MKDLITIPTKIVPYAEANEVLDELIECKQAYDDYSETKAKRKAVGNALAQLIGYFNR
ncbi:MAG: hypothetical protein EZS28_049295, partial [Streblomastix strix]